MDAIERYLSLPAHDDGWVHWSSAGDALLRKDGSTYALAAQVALFIEGFAGLPREDRVPAPTPAGGNLVRLLDFDQMLYLLGFFFKKPEPHAAIAQLQDSLTRRPEQLVALARLQEAFARSRAKSLANAGALCAYLSRDVPRGPQPIDASQLCGTLWSPLLMAEMTRRWRDGTASMQSPAVGRELDRLIEISGPILTRLSELSEADLDHWLKHGSSPLEEDVQRLAEPLPERQERTLEQFLAELEARPRLAGAVPFITQMVSALSLPPRKLKQAELPVGGYADVINRGKPEQLLPSQFAIDDDLEFIRRFAENELLYFRREEPSVQIREELIVLIDQGVRTWGIVRLALTAALFALGRRADKRKLPLRIGGTSNAGRLLPALDADSEVLGRLLDASDLSFDPGSALERVLDERSSKPRDIVLLTHPRSLAESDVSTAARKLMGDTRLFGLAVDEQGQAQLSEFRRGTPMPLRSFRVDLTLPETVPPRVAPSVPASDWQGDIEPIGFPFRFGLSGKVTHADFTMDESWLLAVTSMGLYFAASTDGAHMELLPRPLHAGKLLSNIHAVLGVAGGFAVAGQIDNLLVFAHYDLHARRVKLHVLDSLKQGERPAWRWFYFKDAHVVVADCHGATRAVDLATNQHAFQIPALNAYYPPRQQEARTDSWGNVRLREACERASLAIAQPPWLTVAAATGDYRPPYVRLDRASGTITVADKNETGSEHVSFTPLADGQPALKNAHINGACLRGGVLAAAISGRVGAGPGHGLVLYGVRGGTPLASLNAADLFMLSPAGRYLLHARGHDVLLRRICMGKDTSLLRGRSHPGVNVGLGHDHLTLGIQRWRHCVSWKDGFLEHFRPASWRDLQHPDNRLDARADFLPEWARYDRKRFIAGATLGCLTVVVDVYGQVAVCDRFGKVVCIFFVFRNNLAAWMPDGTRYGPADIGNAAATKDSLQKIGAALKAASAEVSKPPAPSPRMQGVR
ncbi:MAG: hypothetical protein AB7K24_05575 [Gemmataceae bacterium]